MKIKLFILGLSLGISILSGCNDDLTQVGTGIQPENDRPLVYADTFYMKAKHFRLILSMPGQFTVH